MRKLLSALLVLTLLALPLAGLAASPAEIVEMAASQGRANTITVSFAAGTIPADESVVTPITDMLNSLGFRVTTVRDDTGRLDAALTLSGEDALDFALERKDGSTFLKSGLLGEDAVAFTPDEGQTILNRLVDLYAASAKLDEAKTAEAKTALSAMFAGLESGGDAAALSAEVNADTLKPLTDWVAELKARAETKDADKQPAGCDPAVKMVSLTLTADDLTAFYTKLCESVKNSDALMAQLNKVGKLTVDDKQMTAAEMLDYLPGKMGEALKQLKDVPVTLYLDDADQPVYGEATLAAADGAEKPFDGAFTYSRLTDGDGVGHTLTARVTDDAKTTVSLTASLLAGSATKDLFTLDAAKAAEDGKDQKVFSVRYQCDKDRTDTAAKDAATLTLTVLPDGADKETTLRADAAVQAAFDGKDATAGAEIKLFLNDAAEPLFTMNVDSATGDAPASFATDKAVRPAQMSDTEFNTYLGTVSKTALTKLMTLVQNLPASVLKLFSSQTNN